MKQIVMQLLALIMVTAIVACSGGKGRAGSTRQEISSNSQEGPAANASQYKQGEAVFQRYCLSCHQAKGQGVQGMYPPLAGNDILRSSNDSLIKILLQGKSGQLVVNGNNYAGMMPPQAYITDQQVADVLNYVRNVLGKYPSQVTTDEVAAIRKPVMK